MCRGNDRTQKQISFIPRTDGPLAENRSCLYKRAPRRGVRRSGSHRSGAWTDKKKSNTRSGPARNIITVEHLQGQNTASGAGKRTTSCDGILRSLCKYVFTVPCWYSVFKVLKMEAVYTSETSVSTKTSTWRYKPEDCHHRFEIIILFIDT